MSNIGYIRVSTKKQNIDRQLDGVQIDKLFTDKLSGVDTNRPELLQLIDYVRSGDVVHIHSIDRLGRSTSDLKELVAMFNKKGVTVHFHKENWIFSNDEKQSAQSKLLFDIMSSFAEFERNLIKERQAEGIAKAKERGVYMGRKKVIDDLAIIEAMKKDGASFRKVAKKLNVSLSTVQRAMKSKK